jgi:hypothetical protein
MRQTYTETLTINENVDLVKVLIRVLTRWDLSTMPNYVGNNFEIYKGEDVEVLVDHSIRKIKTAYKA